MSARVVVVGSFNQDHVWFTPTLPDHGETCSGRYSIGPGGKGFNQAVAAARSGAKTVFICALGQDDAATQARLLANAIGLDLRDESHAGLPTGSAGIFVDHGGGNMIVVAPGANAALSIDWVQQQHEVLSSAQVVLAQLEIPCPAAERALRVGREAGALTLLNPAPADAATTLELLACADVLIPNESEFSALLDRHSDLVLHADTVSRQSDDELHALCQGLAKATWVITLGARGAFVSHADRRWRGDVLAHYRVGAATARSIDTTGAGDAFSGALAAALARAPEQTFADTLLYATRFAALSTERAGAALVMPTSADVARRFGPRAR